jgi:isopenicillin N synthase-like dioxygenase
MADELDQMQGTKALSTEFSRYDQVDKPAYHLAEAADGADAFDDDFEFTTCDLGRYLHGNAGDKAAFADELGAAMRDIGFVILAGHGVDQALIEAAEDAIPTVFVDSPLEAKLQYRAERHGAVSEGYFPIKETSDIHPDLVEGWVFGRRAFNFDADPSFSADAFWPQPQVEPIFRALVEAELPLFQPIMQAVLQSLDCDPHLFDEKLTDPNLGLRLNYYPPMSTDEQASGAGRLLGHEDIDLFTLLPAAAVEGLQVLRRDATGTGGKWVRLNAPRGSIIMNTGDYMQRITNDLMPSTTHRVSPPQDPSQSGTARVSIPLAAYLRPHEMLEVLPGLSNPKYDPIEVITFHTRTTAKFYGDDYAVN